jgi:hypothetical protein
MKHTPIPWETCKHGTREYAPQFGIYAEGEPHDHCIVKGDNAEADADYIAHCVNLHDELVKVLGGLASAAARIVEDDDKPTLVHMRELDRQRHAASQLIAKAKGNQ